MNPRKLQRLQLCGTKSAIASDTTDREHTATDSLSLCEKWDKTGNKLFGLVSSAARFNWLQGFLAQPACSEVLSLCEVVARFCPEALPYTIQPGILSCVLAPCVRPFVAKLDFAVFPLGGQNSRLFKHGVALLINSFYLIFFGPNKNKLCNL